MSKYIVEGLYGLRRGRPFAFPAGDYHNYVNLGVTSEPGLVDIDAARAEAVPILAHTAMHVMVDHNPSMNRLDESSLYAALLFTHLLVPQSIQSPDPEDYYRKAGASAEELRNMNGMTVSVVRSGLQWSQEKFAAKGKPKIDKLHQTNLGLMIDMLDQMYGVFTPANQFKVIDGILHTV